MQKRVSKKTKRLRTLWINHKLQFNYPNYNLPLAFCGDLLHYDLQLRIFSRPLKWWLIVLIPRSVVKSYALFDVTFNIAFWLFGCLAALYMFLDVTSCRAFGFHISFAVMCNAGNPFYSYSVLCAVLCYYFATSVTLPPPPFLFVLNIIRLCLMEWFNQR